MTVAVDESGNLRLQMKPNGADKHVLCLSLFRDIRHFSQSALNLGVNCVQEDPIPDRPSTPRQCTPLSAMRVIESFEQQFQLGFRRITQLTVLFNQMKRVSVQLYGILHFTCNVRHVIVTAGSAARKGTREERALVTARCLLCIGLCWLLCDISYVIIVYAISQGVQPFGEQPIAHQRPTSLLRTFEQRERELERELQQAASMETQLLHRQSTFRRVSSLQRPVNRHTDS